MVISYISVSKKSCKFTFPATSYSDPLIFTLNIPGLIPLSISTVLFLDSNSILPQRAPFTLLGKSFNVEPSTFP